MKVIFMTFQVITKRHKAIITSVKSIIVKQNQNYNFISPKYDFKAHNDFET